MFYYASKRNSAEIYYENEPHALPAFSDLSHLPAVPLSMIHFFPERAIALTIGTFSIHWYGIMYLLGFLLGAWLLKKLQHYRHLSLSDDEQSSLIVHIILGVLIGGRLGYVLLYEPLTYLKNPFEILAVWHGGMASHGGFIGVGLALLIFCTKKKISIWNVLDVIVVPVAIGLALGRLGNFINGELYGTVTTQPWGMQFPGVVGVRHPTQIYAILKDLTIAITCYYHLKLTAKKHTAGFTTALFLTMYGCLRFIVEMFREQPFGFFTIGPIELSYGQMYTLPIILIGVGLWMYRARIRT